MGEALCFVNVTFSAQCTRTRSFVAPRHPHQVVPNPRRTSRLRAKPLKVYCVADKLQVDRKKQAELSNDESYGCGGFKFLENAKTCADRGVIAREGFHLLEGWYQSYYKALEESMHSINDIEGYCEEMFCTLLKLIQRQLEDPTNFECYHERVREPFDYYQFGMRFALPLVDIWHSKVLGMENVAEAVKLVEAGDNVVFVANHQSEGDPHAVDVLMNKIVGLDQSFAENIVFMAGDRVREDPMVAPFSLGRNLLTVYSKKHINDIPKLRGQKLKHNRKAISATRALFKKGGCCVWFAPSGGRDRRSPDTGKVEIASFDHDSLEMMRITARKSGKPVHFYTMALATYSMLPPPASVGGATLGEPRMVTYAPMHMRVGPKVDWDCIEPQEANDKEDRSKRRAQSVQAIIEQHYESIGGYEQ